jgi:AP-2 complex subunit alpha
VGGKEFAESLAVDVQRLLVSGTVRPIIRKKAALCLLRLYRRNPDVLNKDDWCAHALCRWPEPTCNSRSAGRMP